MSLHCATVISCIIPVTVPVLLRGRRHPQRRNRIGHKYHRRDDTVTTLRDQNSSAITARAAELAVFAMEHHHHSINLTT